MNAALRRRLDYGIALLAALLASVLSLGYAFFGLEYFLMFAFVFVVGAALVGFLGLLTVDLRRDDADDADNA